VRANYFFENRRQDASALFCPRTNILASVDGWRISRHRVVTFEHCQEKVIEMELDCRHGKTILGSKAGGAWRMFPHKSGS